MRPGFKAMLVATLALAGVASCTPEAGQEANAKPEPFKPQYLGIRTGLLDGDLVNFRIAMKGARGKADVEDYARCAAAQYALIRGSAFARHIRTIVTKSGGVWQGDAVYVISPTLPRGELTLDAEVVISDCASRAIPTI